jgi:hypothetical protein
MMFRGFNALAIGLILGFVIWLIPEELVGP